MKKAFSRWYNYVIGIIGVSIVSCIAIIPYFTISDSSKWPYENIRNVYLFSAVVLFGIGFIIQDLFRARHRHKTKNWADPLPEQILDTAWAIFVPFIVSAFFSLILGVIFSFKLF